MAVNSGRSRDRVIVGIKDRIGKPFTEYAAPDGSRIRVWNPSVLKEAYRRADAQLDKALSSVREAEKLNRA